MSSAPTDCRVPDPTDAKADGAFGGNHRAGYGDRLDRIIATARKGWTLAAGEGLILCEEIDWLREALKHEMQWADAGSDSTAFWQQQCDDLAVKLAAVEAERDEAWQRYDACSNALNPFGVRFMDPPDGGSVEVEEQLTRMAQALIEAERILAALREPSEAVVKAVKDAIYEELGIDYWDGKTRRILYYAVAAAEREASA